MDEHELRELLSKQTDIEFSEFLKAKVSAYINDLIRNDFQKLLRILYKIDVDEEKLKKILKEDTERDAGEIIADLILEREKQKIETRKQFKS